MTRSMKSRGFQLAGLAMLSAVAFSLCDRAVAVNEANAAGPDYTTHIQPLLAKHCVRCHGPKLKESELRLDSLSAIQRGGKRGPAVVAGMSGQSPLIKAVRGVRPYREMPPDAASLESADIELLVRWIDSLKEE
jgi:mono/diheme cytochrome c family protein